MGLKVRLRPGAIRQILNDSGLDITNVEIARQFNCSEGAIRKYLNDTIESPSLEMILNWANLLSVEYQDLVIIEEYDPDE